MNLPSVEKKWQKIWEDTKLHSFDPKSDREKYYVLEMFSYPSGAKLHVGHWYNYGPTDSFARFKRMQGYNVFQPMGFDAFGLPAENYAIKTGVHPKDSTMKNIDTMEKQLREMGAMFDWSAEVKTCEEDYYKWTQWMFLKLYENGLAYRKNAPVNWCPSCQTVLANEQAEGGVCERCGSEVVKKDLTQWFLRITKYADELLDRIDGLDWPEKTKLMQKHWIGKSQGGEVEFETSDKKRKIRVFTTRADTLFGVSYIVLAPESPLVDELTTAENAEAVAKYREDCSKINEIERLSTAREKTGVMTGSYAVNPVNGREVPILVADYVLAGYGTGAVMGVPSHDDRDFVFAQKHGLPIERVIKGKTADVDDTLPFTEYGVCVNSGKFDGMTSEEAKIAIIEELAKSGKGELKTNYRLRDWLVSRQRYWGAPIPIIHCEHCGEVAVPYGDLPVKLPYNVEFAPDGKSPLAKSDEFMNTVCPKCGRPAKRDADTLDTFVCSSWYYLRYADSKNDKEPFSKQKADKLLPVDKYVGGAEHACMHLLYARFFTKALRDMGYLDFDEPFKSLVHQGTILGPDGFKMSKSRGNVVSPDEYVKTLGSDAFRLYLMFGFSYTEGGPWSDDGLKAVTRFLDRVERLVFKCSGATYGADVWGKPEKELDYVRNNTIKNVTRDVEAFSFNTAIARIMELLNSATKYEQSENKNGKFLSDVCRDLLLLLAPFTPHFAEELNEQTGGKYSIFNESYPVCNEKALHLDEVEIVLQINSKVRGKAVVPSGISVKETEATVLADEKIKKLIGDATVKKVIVIPEKLVNIVL